MLYQKFNFFFWKSILCALYSPIFADCDAQNDFSIFFLFLEIYSERYSQRFLVNITYICHSRKRCLACKSTDSRSVCTARSNERREVLKKKDTYTPNVISSTRLSRELTLGHAIRFNFYFKRLSPRAGSDGTVADELNYNFTGF